MPGARRDVPAFPLHRNPGFAATGAPDHRRPPRRSGGQVFVEVVHARGVVLDHRLETASAAPVPRERFLARPIQVITVTPTGFSVRA